MFPLYERLSPWRRWPAPGPIKSISDNQPNARIVLARPAPVRLNIPKMLETLRAVKFVASQARIGLDLACQLRRGLLDCPSVCARPYYPHREPVEGKPQVEYRWLQRSELDHSGNLPGRRIHHFGSILTARSLRFRAAYPCGTSQSANCYLQKSFVYQVTKLTMEKQRRRNPSTRPLSPAHRASDKEYFSRPRHPRVCALFHRQGHDISARARQE